MRFVFKAFTHQQGPGSSQDARLSITLAAWKMYVRQYREAQRWRSLFEQRLAGLSFEDQAAIQAIMEQEGLP